MINPSNPFGSGSLNAPMQGSDINMKGLALADKAAAVPPDAWVDQLAQYLESRRIEAVNAKRDVEGRLLVCKELKESKYSATESDTIAREGGTNIFKGLTANKVRAGKAWIHDIYSPKDGKIFGLSPTPLPDLPGDENAEIAEFSENAHNELIEQMVVMSDDEKREALEALKVRTAQMKDAVLRETQMEALERAQNLERRIWDQMIEGGWREAMAAFIDNGCSYPAGFLKGPVPTVMRKLAYSRKGVEVVEKVVLRVTAPSPWDIYTSPGARSVQDGYLFEKMTIARHDLQMLKGQPGFKDAAIDVLLGGFTDGIAGPADGATQARESLEQRGTGATQAPIGTYEIWEYWGYVPGGKLEEWGYKAEGMKLDVLKDYAIRAWYVPVHKRVIHCSLNPHQLGMRPYASASVVSSVDTVWGKGIPDLIVHDQKLANVLMRAMVNNAALSAGPQALVDVALLAKGETVHSPHPGKTWLIDSSKAITGATSRSPIEYFNVPSVLGTILPLYQLTVKDIDELSGIPAYAHGDANVGGAGNTASGLSMLMNSASKVMRDAIRNFDSGGIIPLVQNYIWWNLMFTDDEEIKTDAHVMAIGSLSLFVKEQLQISRQNFLNIASAPGVIEVIGMKGFATLLRSIAEDLQLPSGNIVPSDEEMEAKEAGQQQIQALQALQQQGIIPPEFNPQAPEPLIPASMAQAMAINAQPPPGQMEAPLAGAGTVLQ